MRTFAIAAALVLALAGGGCWVTAPSKDGGPSPLEGAGATITAVAPVLPGPVGGVVAGLGTLLTLAGGFLAGRKKSEAMAKPAGIERDAALAALNPVTKLFAERKWLMPMVSAVIAGGNAANLWHIDTEALVTLVGALNVPAVMEFMKDAKVQSAASPA